MPHLTIEYSENLAENIEISELVKVMHDSAASIEALPLGGLRTRASCREFYLIADGDSSNTFVNVVLRIAPGRSDEVKKQAGEKLEVFPPEEIEFGNKNLYRGARQIKKQYLA